MNEILISPRPYQLEAIDAILSIKEQKITRQLVILPTGTGKTILFGELTKQLNTRTIIIAHREQLVKQAAEKIHLVWPEAEIGICMGEKNDLDSQIVIASIQSASRAPRIQQLKEQGFSLCVVDEAHHAPSESYKHLLKQLGFLEDNADKLLVGVTATPQRQAGGLGNIFQQVAFERSISTMIKGGYLCDLKGYRILTPTNLNGIKTLQGDFVESELAEICNSQARNELIAESFMKHCPKRKAIAFCCDVQHSIDLAKTFNRHNIKASAIYGAMPEDEKDRILKDFSEGKIQILTNCHLLTEGYDQPDISAVIMCRPTRSQPLYTQCIGRGTRLHTTKTDCLVLDFADNYHDIESIATLEKTINLTQTNKEPENKEAISIKKERLSRKVYIGKGFVGDFELLDRSRYAWIAVKEHWLLQLSPTTALWLKQSEKGFTPHLQTEKKLTPLTSRPIPLDYAMGLAEDWLRRNKDFEEWSSRGAQWRGDHPSEKQAAILKKMGYDPKQFDKGQASQLIGQKISEQNLWKHERATNAQRYFLTTNGVPVPKDLTKGAASQMIQSLKRGDSPKAPQP